MFSLWAGLWIQACRYLLQQNHTKKFITQFITEFHAQLEARQIISPWPVVIVQLTPTTNITKAPAKLKALCLALGGKAKPLLPLRSLLSSQERGSFTPGSGYLATQLWNKKFFLHLLFETSEFVLLKTI